MQAQEAANHPTVCRVAPPLGGPGPNVTGAEVEMGRTWSWRCQSEVHLLTVVHIRARFISFLMALEQSSTNLWLNTTQMLSRNSGGQHANHGVSRLGPSRDCRSESTSCLSQLPGAASTPWLMAPLSIVKVMASSGRSLTLALLLPFERTLVMALGSQVAQNNPPSPCP